MAISLDSIGKPKKRPIIMTVIGEPGTGKEQPISSTIITPTGETTMGELKIGDYVVGRNGKKTKVTHIFPQGVKDVYELTLSDGSKVRCGYNHLWTVIDYRKGEITMPLYELMEKYKKKGGQLKYKIPLCKPVKFDSEETAYPPYVIGALIGDGSLVASTVLFSNPLQDIFIKHRMESLLDDSCNFIKGRDTGGCMQYTIGKGSGYPNLLLRHIKSVGLDVRSKYKFIPDEYKFASVDDRKELLFGLMDTDGSCSKNRTSFSTKSERLADDLIWLTQSLGGIAIKRSYDRTSENKGIEYSVNVKTHFNPFKLNRKASQWKLNEKYRMARRIKDISIVGKEEQQCIVVDNDDSLYLTDEFVVTHNSTLGSLFPDPIFITTEDGLMDVHGGNVQAFPLAENSGDVFDAIRVLAQEDHAFKTVVIDSITQLNTMFEKEILDADPGAKSFASSHGGYGSAYAMLAEENRKIREWTGKLSTVKGMHVIYIAHSGVEDITLPDSDPFQRYTIANLHKKSIPHYVGNADVVAHTRLKTYLKGGEDEKKRAIDSGEREIICHLSASNVSKNRLGITEPLPFTLVDNPFSDYLPVI
ncbi:MAG: AAA family ATPase [Candidatus Marinimicrobia bacterium]|jgi:hypothetical protein|nr:AAA family ATPase [Gammaproteobacteria bacterium]MBT4944690.1 AAA family ATPase [Candidatus Neomarinimicrobiota bacterium]HIJ23076.1 AAA family ATPase [Gammaproteobacteria bacterium]